MKTQMKERPILFSAAMVKAILDERKTQTRRAVKPQPPALCHYEMNGNGTHALCIADSSTKSNLVLVPPTAKSVDHRLVCPYGSIGDRLWVRETFLLRAGGTTPVYRADMDPVEAAGFGAMYGGWKPSIFMLRKYCRITLEITGVKVERLSDISEQDAIQEGAEFIQYGCCGTLSGYKSLTNSHNPAFILARDWFKNLWGSINGEDSWAANPWVWALTFKVVQP